MGGGWCSGDDQTREMKEGERGEECGGWLRERVMSSYIYYRGLSVYALCVSVHPNSSHRHALLCFGKMQNQTLCGIYVEGEINKGGKEGKR